jgi:acetyltransferase
MPDESMPPLSLEPFFTPRGVAVIGASRDPGKLSYGIVRNLVDPQDGYPGPVYPVNPKVDEILGLRCYPDISAVPDPVELAVIVVSAGLVPGVVEACGKRGVKVVVIISGGFREVGAEGAARERQLVEIARRYGMRLMGPNGIGVIDTHTPLNTTFVKSMPPRGNIAFLSQSGALCGGIIDWAISRRIGFSRLLSVGNEADVNETDLIPYLVADEASRVITLYLEDIKGGAAFRETLQTAAAQKPVLVIKTGRTQGGQAATASHTGALAGTHAAFRAACRQAGAIEMENIEAMFNSALAFAYQPLPQGDRVALLTNAGGPAALAADTLEANGLSLAHTSQPTQAALRGFLLAEAQVGGPVDMLGGANEMDYRRAMDAVLADPDCDAVLLIIVPTNLLNTVAVIEGIAVAIQAAPSPKPVIACFMGGESMDEAFKVATRSQIPAYTFPEQAVAVLGALRHRARWLAQDHPGPVVLSGIQPERAKALFAAARAGGRMALDAAESRSVLDAYCIPTPPDFLASTAGEAASYAGQIGYPVVLKLASPDILHKSDIGGVLLGLESEEAVRTGFHVIMERARAAYPQANIRGVQVQKQISGGQEVIIGVKRDPTFGALVMFGLGGIYVEALADVSFRLAPLSRTDAGEMIDEVRSARLLKGLRGAAPADRQALVDVLLRVSQLAADCAEIQELDINPLLVLPQGQGALAVDARIILG